MISIIAGLLIVATSLAALRFFMPRNSQPHPLVLKPILDSLIPIAIVGGLGVGVSLFIAGLGIS